MGDSYRPGGGGGGGDGRGRYQAQEYERNYRPQQYDSYPPPQRHYDSRPPPGASSYRPPGPPPSFHGQSRDSDRDRGGFTFRGAAGGQSYRPEQNFTFDAPGPRAPNGFAPDGPQGTRERPRRFDRDNGRPRHPGRGSGAPRGRGRGFGPKPAHDRAILSKMAGSRETTPEQFEGMNDGQSHFREVAESSEGDDSDDDGPRKRKKVEASDAPAAPKWSNPDPYTVLPPPETLGAPKKDIVQTIRKAKNEAAAKVDKVADNSDFISFNFDDDEDDAEMDPPSPPVTKSPAQSGEPSFSHRDSFHRKTSTNTMSQTNGASSASFTPINQRPQAPVSISSDSDYAEAPSIVPERVSRPPKRKARDTRQFGDVTEEWQSIDGQPVAPWCTRDHSSTASIGLRLHKEICDFFEYVKPRPFEEAARLDLVQRIQTAVRAWGGANGFASDCEVHCFGSFASGLYLPTADMDLVVLSKSFQSGGPRQIGQSQNQLRGLTQHIERLGIAKPRSATFIGRSKVPIVKFTDKRTGIKVDISFENDSGFPALKTFEEWKEKYPAMPVLVALVKQILVMRGINEVFCGGIGGFTTICLVTHILQTMPQIQSGAMDPQQHYNDVFMKILDFFGNKIDIRSTGILMHPPYLYDKDKHPRTAQNNDRLTIIDPNNPDNDISGGSHKIDTVFGCFRAAYSELQRYMSQLHKGSISTSSILECILGGNYQPVESQRERLRQLYGTVTPSAVPSLPPAPYIPPGVKKTPAPKAPRAPKQNKKAKLREQNAAAAQGQYAPPVQKAAPPVSSAPKYVAPMASSPLRSEDGGGNGIVPIIAPPFHYSQYPAYPPPISSFNYPAPQHVYHAYNAGCWSQQGIPLPSSIPPPPSPSHLAVLPPPPPPEPRKINAPSSPASSVSMDMSD